MVTTTDYLFDSEPNLASSAVEAEIRRLEIEWGEAYERRDFATLNRILADDYVLTDPLGSVRNKTESMAAIECNDVSFQSSESENVKVWINGDTAIVTARSTFRGHYKGWPIAGRYQYTDVFVKRGGSWKAVVSHITALGTGPLRLRMGRLVCDFVEGLVLPTCVTLLKEILRRRWVVQEKWAAAFKLKRFSRKYG